MKLHPAAWWSDFPSLHAHVQLGLGATSESRRFKLDPPPPPSKQEAGYVEVESQAALKVLNVLFLNRVIHWHTSTNANQSYYQTCSESNYNTH
jgi:hypothetical protein